MMSKNKKSKKTSKTKAIKGLLLRLLLVAVAFGGYYLYQNPELLIGQSSGEDMISSVIPNSSKIVSSQQKNIETILGKTTSLVEEGLENIKVPKNLTGANEDIVLQEVFDNFTQKVKDLPNDQIDRIKVQFCQDLLSSVENASVETK